MNGATTANKVQGLAKVLFKKKLLRAGNGFVKCGGITPALIDNARARTLNRPYRIIQNPVIHRQRTRAAKAQRPSRRIASYCLTEPGNPPPLPRAPSAIEATPVPCES